MLTIKDYAMEAATLGDNINQEQIKKGIPFSLILVQYPDFVVEKKTPKQTKQLVFMPSIQRYYIKTTKNGEETIIEILTRELYRKFTEGLKEGDITFPDNFWIKNLESGMTFYDQLFEYLSLNECINAIKLNCAPKFKMYFDEYALKRELDAFSRNKILFSEFKSEKQHFFLTRCVDLISDITESFGLDNARDFMKELDISVVESLQGKYTNFGRGIHREKGNSPRPNIPMEYKKFKDYVLYQSVRCGYADQIDTFFKEWNDTLEMQEKIFGKIKEKYPKDLAQYHNILSYKSRKLRTIIDQNKFESQVQRCIEYEAKIPYGTQYYSFTVPKSDAEFYDEAQQQANCLASYINKFINGECMIFFMRYAETPEDSLVTIEVVNGRINQAYQARNVRVTHEQHEAIKTWAQKFGFEY